MSYRRLLPPFLLAALALMALAWPFHVAAQTPAQTLQPTPTLAAPGAPPTTLSLIHI